MASSNMLIYRISDSSLLNYYISQGIAFEVHPFSYLDALVLVLKDLSTGDMQFVVMQSKDQKVHTYNSGETYLANYYTPETVADDAKTQGGLIDGEGLSYPDFLDVDH